MQTPFKEKISETTAAATGRVAAVTLVGGYGALRAAFRAVPRVKETLPGKAVVGLGKVGRAGFHIAAAVAKEVGGISVSALRATGEHVAGVCRAVRAHIAPGRVAARPFRFH